MKQDAEANAEDDKRRFELASARNKGEQMCHQVEKMIEEYSEKLQDSDKEPLNSAIEKVREAAKGEDPAAIETAVKELEQASHALSKMMYESEAAQSAEASDNGATPEAAGDDDAIDAEFEVNKD